MVDVRALKAEMVRNGYNHQKLADALGITTRTLTNRFKACVFGSDEIEKMVEILNIEDPLSIFFTNKVS